MDVTLPVSAASAARAPETPPRARQTANAVVAIKSFDKVYILTNGGPGGATKVPAYYSWQNFFEKTQVGYGAAIATVLTLITVVLTVVFLRRQDRLERADT